MLHLIFLCLFIDILNSIHQLTLIQVILYNLIEPNLFKFLRKAKCFYI